MRDTRTLIKTLRESGMSQTEIAKRTGIPQPRLSRWEAGEVPDAADDSLRLAQLVAELEAGQADPPPEDHGLSKLAERVGG
jgi:transcriptional regulator with XRE-family HTH domain